MFRHTFVIDRFYKESESEVTQSCPTLCDLMECKVTVLLCPWDFPGKKKWNSSCSMPLYLSFWSIYISIILGNFLTSAHQNLPILCGILSDLCYITGIHINISTIIWNHISHLIKVLLIRIGKMYGLLTKNKTGLRQQNVYTFGHSPCPNFFLFLVMAAQESRLMVLSDTHDREKKM